MPGPPFLRGPLVNHALISGKLIEDDVDACVRRILQFVNRLLPLGIPSNAPETTIDTKETAAYLRQVASSSIVLLRNQNKVLPFAKEKSVCLGPGFLHWLFSDTLTGCCHRTKCENSRVLWWRKRGLASILCGDSV